MKEMQTTYNPKEFEERIYAEWMEGKCFHATADKKKVPFTVMMPPPNITGRLHMGHAMDETMQDIIVRFKRMQGYSVLWLPGTDHASLATEHKIAEKIREEGTTKEALGREEFLRRAWAWKEEYGGWLAPYTDHTLIRVPFMISIAIISLMRYYNIKKNEDIKDMIVDAAKDLTENAYLDSGYFYYKELGSLKRNAGNTTLLEAMTAAYQLTGNKDFLMYGKKTYLSAVGDNSITLSFAKRAEEDALVLSGNSSKGVGQSFLPLLTYHTACIKAGIRLFKEEEI